MDTRLLALLKEMIVDFQAAPPEGGVELVQVCDLLASPAACEREIRALNEAMLELGVKSGTIVTRSETGGEQVSAGDISIQPAWQWLLSREAC